MPAFTKKTNTQPPVPGKDPVGELSKEIVRLKTGTSELFSAFTQLKDSIKQMISKMAALNFQQMLMQGHRNNIPYDIKGLLKPENRSKTGHISSKGSNTFSTKASNSTSSGSSSNVVNAASSSTSILSKQQQKKGTKASPLVVTPVVPASKTVGTQNLMAPQVGVQRTFDLYRRYDKSKGDVKLDQRRGKYFATSEAGARGSQWAKGDHIEHLPGVQFNNVLSTQENNSKDWWNAKEFVGLPREATQQELNDKVSSMGFDALHTGTGDLERVIDLRNNPHQKIREGNEKGLGGDAMALLGEAALGGTAVSNSVKESLKTSIEDALGNTKGLSLPNGIPPSARTNGIQWNLPPIPPTPEGLPEESIAPLDVVKPLKKGSFKKGGGRVGQGETVYKGGTDPFADGDYGFGITDPANFEDGALGHSKLIKGGQNKALATMMNSINFGKPIEKSEELNKLFSDNRENKKKRLEGLTTRDLRGAPKPNGISVSLFDALSNFNNTQNGIPTKGPDLAIEKIKSTPGDFNTGPGGISKYDHLLGSARGIGDPNDKDFIGPRTDSRSFWQKFYDTGKKQTSSYWKKFTDWRNNNNWGGGNGKDGFLRDKDGNNKRPGMPNGLFLGALATTGLLARAGSPDSLNTFMKSLELAGATMGKSFAEPLIYLSKKVQDFAKWWDALPTATQDNFAWIATFTALGTGAVLALGLFTRAVYQAIIALNFLGKLPGTLLSKTPIVAPGVAAAGVGGAGGAAASTGTTAGAVAAKSSRFARFVRFAGPIGAAAGVGYEAYKTNTAETEGKAIQEMSVKPGTAPENVKNSVTGNWITQFSKYAASGFNRKDTRENNQLLEDFATDVANKKPGWDTWQVRAFEASIGWMGFYDSDSAANSETAKKRIASGEDKDGKKIGTEDKGDYKFSPSSKVEPMFMGIDDVWRQMQLSVLQDPMEQDILTQQLESLGRGVDAINGNTKAIAEKRNAVSE